MKNPFQSTGVVVAKTDSGPAFCGTCFALRDHLHFITAAHVVGKHSPSVLGVALFLYQDMSEEEGLPVRSVSIHDKADVAVIRLDVEEYRDSEIFDPFQGVSKWADLGDAVRTFGFPTQSTSAGSELVPRMLRGYIQRNHRHESPLGFEYPAIELSHTAPSGMSGSPVSLDGDSSNVIGVLVEDYHSSTILDSHTNIEEDGTHYREEMRRVITYGIATDLRPLRQWIWDKLADGKSS